MNEGRSFVSVARWNDSLFLAGGGSVSVEEFNPSDLTFTLLPLQLNFCSAVVGVVDDWLIVLKGEELTVFDFTTRRITSQLQIEPVFWSCLPVVVSQASLYWYGAGNGAFYQFDVSSMRLIKE